MERDVNSSIELNNNNNNNNNRITCPSNPNKQYKGWKYSHSHSGDTNHDSWECKPLATIVFRILGIRIGSK